MSYKTDNDFLFESTELLYGDAEKISIKGLRILPKKTGVVNITANAPWGDSCTKKITILSPATRVDGQEAEPGRDGFEPYYTYNGKCYSDENCLNEISDPTVIHFWDDGAIAKKASFSHDGEYIRTCINCGEQERTPIYKLDDVVIQGTAFEFTGREIEPDISVVDSEGNELQKDEDYNVSFFNNENVGIASLLVTGCGKYSGTRTYNFMITQTSIADASIESLTEMTYDGKEKEPALTISKKGNLLIEGKDYIAMYKNNVNAGNGKVTVYGINNYSGTLTASFAIVKSKNTLTAKGKTATIKYANVKKKAQTIKRANVLTVSKAKGKVTYTKKSGNKKVLINKTTGNVTVQKGLKKGTYKVTVKVKAAGNSNYKSLTKNVTFKIKNN